MLMFLHAGTFFVPLERLLSASYYFRKDALFWPRTSAKGGKENDRKSSGNCVRREER